MVIIFLFFGYQKWFEYEAQVLIPYRSGHLEHFCSWGSGIRNWEFSERSVRVLRSYVRSLLFHLCRTAGPPLGGTGFAQDSSLEGGVRCELVSESEGELLQKIKSDPRDRERSSVPAFP